ncbi:MAG: hypothetical protein AAAB35_01460 [Phyllobacterium sp.]|uniref:hypothetical protein n=1 Tax=Phyllobacterium sp. TaxID=1871046 RepID=UPI0030F248B9
MQNGVFRFEDGVIIRIDEDGFDQRIERIERRLELVEWPVFCRWPSSYSGKERRERTGLTSRPDSCCKRLNNVETDFGPSLGDEQFEPDDDAQFSNQKNDNDKNYWVGSASAPSARRIHARSRWTNWAALAVS